MITVQVLSSPPASSVSGYRIKCRNPLYTSLRRDFRIHFQCVSCCAYFDLGFTLKTSYEKKNHGLGDLGEVSNTRFLAAKQRLRRKPFSSESIKTDSCCVAASKVATLECDSVCEERSAAPVQEEREDLTKSCSQQILPPWSDQDLEDENHIADSFETSARINDDSEGGVYYLEERDEEILSKRILKLSRLNKIRSSLALYSSMKLSGLLPKPHACNSLLTCLIRNGRVSDALQIFEFMKEKDITTGHSYSLILKAVAKFQGRDAALRMFEEAVKDDRTKKCIDAVVYNTMIAIFGKVNDWVWAERIWRSMQDNGHIGTVITYRLLICIFTRCNQSEMALDAYDEMIRNNIRPGNDAMEAIIGACSREGKWDIALNVVQSMLNSEVKPSLTAFNALINSLGKASKVELAFEMYSLLKSFGYEPDAFTWNALLIALNQANRYSDALRLFESIRKDYGSVLNLHIYNTCLMSCKRLGLWERAMQLLWQLEASNVPISVTSYNLVIGACEAARKPEVALEIYEHMIQQKQSPDVFTLLSLIRVCIWGSFWFEVEEILNIAPNGSLYNAAIQGMCLRKKTDLARKLYTKMRELGLEPDSKTRALMLQNLPQVDPRRRRAS